ncbi:MAG: aquaporin family protein [Cryobacterium sp.]|nr:aquaporin family protein [Cryobacterium sp.]
MDKIDTRKIAAEAVGTFVFFLIGLMSVLSTKAFNNPGYPGTPNPFVDLVVIAFGFGFGLLAAIFIAGHVSGGHYNPAVTIAAVMDKRLDPMYGVGYIVAQLVGGIAAALVVAVIFGQSAVAGTETHPGGGVSEIQALIIEIVFTAIFLAVILTVTKKAANHAAFVIPITLMVIHLAIVPFTGSSVNPARSLASAIVGGDLTGIWIYIIGPVVGGLIGWGVFKFLTPKPDEA